MTDDRQKIKPLPLLVGPANAEAVTGFPWRWCRDTAAALNVPFVGHARKRALRADLFLAALEQHSTDAETPRCQLATRDADPAEAVRAILRRAGGQ